MKKLVIAAVLLGAGIWGYLKWRDWKPDADAARLANRPTTAVVENRDIKFSVTAAGDIGPAEQVSVRPEVNGRIEKLAVDIGDSVKVGDLLFTLDDRDLQIAKESQETEIERAKLQREQADRNYKRSQQLYAENLIAQELFEETRTLHELARNALERAQKELDLVNDRLRKTRIEAPFDCTVLTRPVSVGQAVSGSGGFNSGTEVLTIANLNEMVINAHINQADVTRLKSGQDVEVQVEAVPGLVVTGTVERIAPQATIRNNVKGFAARILLKDVDKRIRPGMTANIKIPVAAAENVVAVPLAAVFTEIDPQTGRSARYVFVKTAQGQVRRPVQIGISDFFFAEVQDGLAQGETVLLEQPKEEQENAGSLIAKGQPGQGQGGPGGGSGPRPATPAQTRETPSGSQTPASRTPTNAPGPVRPRGNTS